MVALASDSVLSLFMNSSLGFVFSLYLRLRLYVVAPSGGR